MTVLAAHSRELFANLVRREVRAGYRGSALGLVRTLVTPLVMMLAYTLVCSIIFPFVDDRIPHYPVYLLTGLALAGALTVSATYLVENKNLVKKERCQRARRAPPHDGSVNPPESAGGTDALARSHELARG